MCSLESVVEYPVDTLGFGGSGRCVVKMEMYREGVRSTTKAPAVVYLIWRWASLTSNSRNMEKVFAITSSILS